jgi:hypothetical protein
MHMPLRRSAAWAVALALAWPYAARAQEPKVYAFDLDLYHPPANGAVLGKGAKAAKISAGDKESSGEIQFEDGWFFCKVKRAALADRGVGTALNLVGGMVQGGAAGEVAFYAELVPGKALKVELEVVAVRKEQRATSGCWPEEPMMPIIACDAAGPCTEPWKNH